MPDPPVGSASTSSDGRGQDSASPRAEVVTPGAQGDVATGTSPTSIAATVVGVRGPGDNGQIVVDVSVPFDQAAELAARAATGKIALVLDSRER